MSRKDELIREAAAEIDRINKVLGRVEYRGWFVPFGVDDALALVKRLLAEAGDADEGTKGLTEREAEAGELAPAEPAAGEPLPWLLALSTVLEEMRDEER